MDCRLVTFGEIEIDGEHFTHDVVVEGGRVRRRKKKPSKPYRDEYGHTPLTPKEEVPWSAPLLVVGTGANGQLPVTDEFYKEAEKRGVQVVARPTSEACKLLADADPKAVAAILHVTC